MQFLKHLHFGHQDYQTVYVITIYHVYSIMVWECSVHKLINLHINKYRKGKQGDNILLYYTRNPNQSYLKI